MNQIDSLKQMCSESSIWQDCDTRTVDAIFSRNAPRTTIKTLLYKFTKMIGLSTATRGVGGIISRRLSPRSSTSGKILITSTPTGDNHFYDLYMDRAKQGDDKTVIKVIEIK